MSKSNYKRLGKYIREVSEKNKDLEVHKLLGVSIKKIFIPSIANTIGTDMSKYKIVREKQFAYGPVTSRNGEKISVALLQESDCIISTSYTVFEVIDQDKLDPEYLMMWFRRPEFDRYARYMSHGSVREIFDWDEMCNIELPVPSIEKQRAIVEEYNTIADRIKLNERMNQKLEETAQAIYKHWFVDFEFPDEKGKPYKSSGGKMVWNEELGKDVPEGWRVGKLGDVCDITSSKRIFEREYQSHGIPFYRGKEITQKMVGEIINEPIYISVERYKELVDSFGKPSIGDILMTAVGTIGSSYMVQNEEFYFKDGNIIWLKNFKQEGINYLIYDNMQNEQFDELINEITIGSTQNAITITTLGMHNIIIPKENVLIEYKNYSRKIHNKIIGNRDQNYTLFELRNILLSKLTTIGEVE